MASYSWFILLGCVFCSGITVKSQSTSTAYPSEDRLTCNHTVSVLFSKEKWTKRMVARKSEREFVQDNFLTEILEEITASAHGKILSIHRILLHTCIYKIINIKWINGLKTCLMFVWQRVD